MCVHPKPLPRPHACFVWLLAAEALLSHTACLPAVPVGYALDEVKELPVIRFTAPGETSGSVLLDNR